MIINNDIIKWCKEQEWENKKYHAVLCDPPYELGFMGKSWDSTGIAFDPKTWKAISDQLYPGAYLLAFGGTRTFHRIAVAIEDAGFEIRDTVGWIYAQGFPKSHNFGCKCRDSALPYTYEKETGDIQTEHNLRPMPEADLQVQGKAKNEQSEVLLSRLQEQGISEYGKARPESETSRSEQSGVEGRGDILEKARQLQADKVCPMSEGVSADGSEGRIHNGASAGDGDTSETIIDENGSSASHKSRPERQSDRESDAIPEQQGAQTSRVERCPKCNGLIDWSGYGTALKPSWEPIIIARKPLEGTVAQNALKYGSGALNIDGCRVGTEQTSTTIKDLSQAHGNQFGKPGIAYPSQGQKLNPPGRWPANLIHDGSDEVVGMFPNTKGGGSQRGSKEWKVKKGFSHQVGQPPPENYIVRDDGTGSAARFFYSAKVSKSERDAGLEGFEETADTAKGNGLARICEFCGASQLKPELCQCETKSWVLPKQKNNHPTLKPISLTTYLAKLILPPKLDQPRRLLVPFSGAGSEVIGALKAGWDEVTGVEQDAEYCKIAEARIKHWIK